jgi:hypothetical protein
VSVTVPEASPVAAALAALLTAGLASTAVTVYVGQRGSATRCVVLHVGPGDVASLSLADERSGLDVEFQVTAVGSGPDQAAWVADKARAVLLAPGAVTVSGRSTSRIYQEQAPPEPIPDNDVQPPLWTAPVRYRLQTLPA